MNERKEIRNNRSQIITRWLCASLVLFTILLNFKHVWDVLQINPQTRKAMAATFVSEFIIVAILILDMIACGLFLFQKTFKAGVVLQSLTVLVVAGLQIRAGHSREAVLELPFFCATLIMFYLGYPFTDLLRVES